jgi:hypothetical protein
MCPIPDPRHCRNHAQNGTPNGTRTSTNRKVQSVPGVYGRHHPERNLPGMPETCQRRNRSVRKLWVAEPGWRTVRRVRHQPDLTAGGGRPWAVDHGFGAPARQDPETDSVPNRGSRPDCQALETPDTGQNFID